MFHGTTITCLRTPDFIVVGADSKIVTAGFDSPHMVGQKIQQVDNLLFASAGLLQDYYGNFNIAQTIRDLRLQGGTIQETVNRFSEAIIGPMRSAVEMVCSNFPAHFEVTAKKGFVSEVLFFGIEELRSTRDPVVHSLRFTKVDCGPSIQIEVLNRSCPTHDPSEIAFLALGEADAINRHLDMNPKFWHQSGGVPEGMQKLLEIAILDKPLHVGPPIKIVVVHRSGITWI